MDIRDLNKGFKQIEDRLRKELAKSDGTKTTYTESDVINNCIDMIFSLKHILNNKIESGEYKEVMRGEWVDGCFDDWSHPFMNYCPNCGAYMKGDK